MFVLLALIAAVTGCGDDASGDGTSNLGGEDGGVCEKDSQALAQLLAQPQACTTSETCPTGSHCGATGQCDWQCIANSDCGFGYDCTCDGQCILTGTGPDAGVPTDPSCPRDRDLLLNNTLSRTCSLDEDCPFGSHCDSGTGQCAYECLATADPALPCTGTDVCDCRGRCVPPSGAPRDIVATGIRLEVPEMVSAQPGWTGTGPDSPWLDIILRSAQVPQTNPTIVVRAPFGFSLKAEEWGPGGNETVSLSGWAFTWWSGEYVASKRVYIHNYSNNVVEADAPWAIDVIGGDSSCGPANGFACSTASECCGGACTAGVCTGGPASPITETIVGAPRSVLVTFAPAATTPTSGIYAGRLTPRSALGAGITSIPVTAWVTEGHIVFFDGHHAVSPNGVLGIDRSGAPVDATWLDHGTGGRLGVQLVSTIAPSTGTEMTGGRFAVKLPLPESTPLEFDYELSWQGPLTAQACATDNDCSVGPDGAPAVAYCDEGIGYCIAGEDWRGTPAGFTNTLISERAQAWIDAASWFLVNPTPEMFGTPVAPGEEGLGRSLMCLAPGHSVNTAPYSLAPGFHHHASETASISGELVGNPEGGWNEACMQPVPLGLNRERSIAGAEAQLAGEELLAACLNEAVAEPPPGSSTSPTDTFSAWFGSRSHCLSPARLYPMIEWLTGGPNTGHRGGTEARILHAVVSRWLDALSFIGGQASEQVTHDQATALDAGDTRSDLDRALEFFESAFELVLKKQTSDALLALPRDVLRLPDYRQIRPVAYYTFDPEDMNGATVLDVVGEAHGTLGSPSYTRPPASCSTGECADGIRASGNWMTIPRGPTELYGDFEIAFSFKVPVLDPENDWGSSRQRLIEFGDATNVLYEIGVDAFGLYSPRLYVRHGPRSTAALIPLGNQLTTGQTYHVILTRKARYTSGANPWATEYTARFNGSSTFIASSNTPLVTTLAPSTAKGGVGFGDSGYINELAFWDEPVATYVGGFSLTTRTVDNYLLTPLVTLPNDSNHEQPIGLSAILLETTAQYLSTTATASSLAEGEVYADCVAGGEGSPQRQRVLGRASRALRTSWAIEALATQLNDRARTPWCSAAPLICPAGTACGLDGAGEVACISGGAANEELDTVWTERYQHALAELDAARTELMRVLGPMVSCADPYGISPAAVPLYFGDPVGTNARFFAASDYLLKTWAEPAVAKAESSLENARSSWLAKRNSEIQQLQTEQQHEARLEQIEISYAQGVIEFCGLVGVDPLDVLDQLELGTLQPETCFRVGSTYCATDEGQASAECYRGELGKAALTIVSAARGIEVARKSAEAAENRWASQDAFCSEMQERNAADLQALEKHTAKLRELRRMRSIWGAIGSALGGLSTGNPLGALGGVAGALSTKYEKQMADAEGEFQVYQQQRIHENQSLACYHEADQIKYGLDVEYAVIGQRLVDVELAALQLQNGINRIRQIRVEAKAALAREAARTVPSVAHHYWLDSKIDRYERDFEWARRLTLLAARAVEYEVQQSLPAVANVLRARSAQDLSNVIVELQQEQASRTVNGRRPQESSVVISLRDDILKLSDRVSAGLPFGERNWAPDTRFGERLEEKLFAVYDDGGAYLGQGIPFTLAPEGALNYRCAERVWRLNATIQGDIPGQSTPSVPVMILKRNTFASQWCEGKGDGSPFQEGTVFPSANLFDLEGGGTSDGEMGAFTAALLMPWFNVIRSDFYKAQYVEGSSEEFAGRGLYGDYVLVFPELGLLEWTDSVPDNDFPLKRIEDVLIRFDLISIDDLNL